MKTRMLAALLVASLVPAAARSEEPRKVAFVDTGNTGRSVTAEALAAATIREQHLPIAVIGRGVDVDPFDADPEPNAAALLRRHGIDVSGHRAVQITAQDVKHADVILTMTAKHKQAVLAAFPEAAAKVFTLSNYATGTEADIADAYGKPMSVYEATYGQIASAVGPALSRAQQQK